MICNIILIYQRKEESLYPDLALAAVLIPGKIMPYYNKNLYSLILNALDNDFIVCFGLIATHFKFLFDKISSNLKFKNLLKILTPIIFSNRKVTSALSAVGENGRRSPLSSLGMEEYSPETKPRRDTFSPEPGRLKNALAHKQVQPITMYS